VQQLRQALAASGKAAGNGARPNAGASGSMQAEAAADHVQRLERQLRAAAADAEKRLQQQAHAHAAQVQHLEGQLRGQVQASAGAQAVADGHASADAQAVADRHASADARARGAPAPSEGTQHSTMAMVRAARACVRRMQVQLAARVTGQVATGGCYGGPARAACRHAAEPRR
jgi:hypothetical protein